ncbi:MAG TPA: hypothetical protein VHK05_01740 [Candidatus Limnocylindrales bacterium]|nr:hypothetical protein [Candidatus Limnocylindrales bacterium]
MGFLRRILGGGEVADLPDETPVDQAELDADERARDLELARNEQERLSDLARRQMRYAAYAWQPPDQGGERRSDDEGPTEIA